MNFQHMLGKVGLTTREELTQAQAKKEIWHSLVRDVFARYYLKMREAFPDQLPDLPRKYSAGWEDHIKSELSNFLSTDLQDVDPLLRACGFGTEKWQQFVEETLPEMDAIVDSHLNGEIAIGRAPATDRELAQELSEARKEIRQLRSAGRRALTRLKDYERQIDELRQNGHGESFTALFPEYADADHDEEDDYQPDQTADDRESNGNPADLFSERSETADDRSATAEFFADDDATQSAVPLPADEETRGAGERPADLFAPGEMPPAASGRKTDPAEPITDEDYVELQRQNEELRPNSPCAKKNRRARQPTRRYGRGYPHRAARRAPERRQRRPAIGRQR